MLEIQKQYVLDEQHRTLTVQIVRIAIFNQIEEFLENFDLIKLMEEVENDEIQSGDDAYSYYQLLKKQNVGS